jgi:hypothetical protein
MKKFAMFIGLFFVLLLFVGGFFGYKLYALNSMYGENVALKDFSMGDNFQLQLSLAFDVVNPSALDNKINGVAYRAYLVEYDEELFSGTLHGAIIPSGESRTFIVNEQLDWVPDVPTALAMLDKNTLTLEFTTVTDVDYFGMDISSEKKVVIDIAKYVKPLIQQQVDKFSNMFGGLFG